MEFGRGIQIAEEGLDEFRGQKGIELELRRAPSRLGVGKGRRIGAIFGWMSGSIPDTGMEKPRWQGCEAGRECLTVFWRRA